MLVQLVVEVMQLIAKWPESRIRQVRWVLIIGWCLLIASLLLLSIHILDLWTPKCIPEMQDCDLH